MSYDQHCNRMPVKTAPGRFFTLAVALLLASSACKTRTEDDNTTNAFVQVLSVGASVGEIGGAGDTVSDLFSDVCFSSEDFPPCSVFNDNATVTLTAFPKDASQPTSQMTTIVFERYRVTYIRADGRNVPGVDVPHPFDGVANFAVPTDGSVVERSFIVVRHQAKREPPLIEMALNPAGILSVIAQIDLFGRDTAGRPITVTAFLNITFGDFANEE